MVVVQIFFEAEITFNSAINLVGWFAFNLFLIFLTLVWLKPQGMTITYEFIIHTVWEFFCHIVFFCHPVVPLVFVSIKNYISYGVSHLMV